MQGAPTILAWCSAIAARMGTIGEFLGARNFCSVTKQAPPALLRCPYNSLHYAGADADGAADLENAHIPDAADHVALSPRNNRATSLIPKPPPASCWRSPTRARRSRTAAFS